MPIKARQETLAQLSDNDIKALKALYWHRCMDESLLQKYIYYAEEGVQGEFTLKRIQWMLQQELLEMDSFGEDEHCVFYLSNRGIQTLRAICGNDLYIVDSKTRHKSYEVTSSKLRVANKLLNHQLYLNSLSLDIEKKCHLPEECYKDSKFADNFTYAQPDGVFELPEFDVLLEMDMAHERVSDLMRKWEHYRNYLSSREYYLRRDKKIIVLFATENIKRGFSYRRSKILTSLSQSIFDLFGNKFECYIGTSNEMSAVAQQIICPKCSTDAFIETGRFLQSQMGFIFSRPEVIQNLCGESYLYMRRTDSMKRTLIQDGRPQNFFLENYLTRPISVLHRIVEFERTLSLLANKIGENIPLLVIVPDENKIYQDLRAVDGLGLPHVYFTTLGRLQLKLLPEALFQFDQLGNRFHFTNYALSERVHEKRGG